MSINCDQLPESFWLDHDYSRSEFEQRLRIVGRTEDSWTTIADCVDCDQRWRLDTPDKYTVDLAIKVSKKNTWTEADDRKVRIDYLKRSYDGESIYKCTWGECPNKALKGVLMCAEHLYEKMGTRAKGV